MGTARGWTLARAHARSGDRVAIAAYLGRSDTFDQAIADFLAAYADQTSATTQHFAPPSTLAAPRHRKDSDRRPRS